MIKFQKLNVYGWKQFERIEIDFHSNLTVLTGANGSGKTTILNLLAKHFGWYITELATPSRDESTGIFKFIISLFKRETATYPNSIGEILYNNGVKGSLTFPFGGNGQAQYNIDIQSMQPVRGLNIPSHRPVFLYQPVAHISTQKRTKEEAYQLAYQSIFGKLYSENYGTKTTNYYIKETLLSWAIGGSGNEFIQADDELRKNFLDFQGVLTKILPSSLGFKSISIRNYEIVLITDTGEFMLDAVSGGISAIIDLGWQIFTYSGGSIEPITVLIDEIENHLHATMQRSILPSLIQAFPNVQFIISTHSPLVIGSVKDSNVYAFRYNKFRKIYNEKLDLVNKAKNANEILNEVLGVPFTMPIWVESTLNTVIEKYTNMPLKPTLLKEMREELKHMGLENLVPLAIEKAVENRDDKNF